MASKTAVILAAGKSTRMKSDLPKVLHEVCGKEMLAYVLEACRDAGIEKIVLVVGHAKNAVIERFDGQGIIWVEQTEQLGTGHAVLCCQDAIGSQQGDTVVLCGDGPMIRSETLKILLEEHDQNRSAATMLTAELDDPTGYGRIVRDEKGNIKDIVEHNDCTQQQLQIKEVNPSYYCFDNELLFETLRQIKPNNAKNEYYITDVVKILIAKGKTARAIKKMTPEDVLSINSQADLAMVNEVMRRRIQR